MRFFEELIPVGVGSFLCILPVGVDDHIRPQHSPYFVIANVGDGSPARLIILNLIHCAFAGGETPPLQVWQSPSPNAATSRPPPVISTKRSARRNPHFPSLKGILRCIAPQNDNGEDGFSVPAGRCGHRPLQLKGEKRIPTGINALGMTRGGGNTDCPKEKGRHRN